MAIRTKGDLNGFTTRDESTYGTFNTSGTSVYGGVLSGWDDGLTYDTVEDAPQEEGYAFSNVVFCAKTFGFSADMTIPRGQNILSAWLKRATGADLNATGPKRDVTPFSTAFHKGDSECLAYFGSKLDSFTIKADGRGKPIQFSAVAFSRYMAIGTGTSFINLGTSVSFERLSRPTGAPITYCTPIKFNSATDLKAKSWTLSINNHLQREEDGVIVNSTCYPLSAGLDSVPTDREIILEVTRSVTDGTWDTIKYNASSNVGYAIELELDGLKITLYYTYVEPKLCKASQGTYDETIRFHARAIKFATSS